MRLFEYINGIKIKCFIAKADIQDKYQVWYLKDDHKDHLVPIMKCNNYDKNNLYCSFDKSYIDYGTSYHRKRIYFNDLPEEIKHLIIKNNPKVL